MTTPEPVATHILSFIGSISWIRLSANLLDSGIVSDAELLVLTGGKTPQIKFTFKDDF